MSNRDLPSYAEQMKALQEKGCEDRPNDSIENQDIHDRMLNRLPPAERKSREEVEFLIEDLRRLVLLEIHLISSKLNCEVMELQLVKKEITTMFDKEAKFEKIVEVKLGVPKGFQSWLDYFDERNEKPTGS